MGGKNPLLSCLSLFSTSYIWQIELLEKPLFYRREKRALFATDPKIAFGVTTDVAMTSVSVHVFGAAAASCNHFVPLMLGRSQFSGRDEG